MNLDIPHQRVNNHLSFLNKIKTAADFNNSINNARRDNCDLGVCKHFRDHFENEENINRYNKKRNFNGDLIVF